MTEEQTLKEKIERRKEYMRNYRQVNKVRLNESRNEWVKNNKDKRQTQEEKYYDKYKETLLLKGREYRENNPDKVRESRIIANSNQKKKAPEKIKARQLLNKALEKGLIKKASFCSGCEFNRLGLFAHHYDYTKPLDVIWLCIACHAGLHRRLRAELRSKNNGELPEKESK